MTRTQQRIVQLWSAAPSSRTEHRLAELRRLVWRDLKRTAAARRKARGG